MSAGWNTIESDAGVFTSLVESLGVKDVQFEEVVSLDADDLDKLSPIFGVIFLFKHVVCNNRSPAMDNTNPPDGSFDYEAAENIFFASQTIQNACATQALLSVLLNKDGDIDIGDQLRKFKDFTASFPPMLRGEALSNSELIRTTHNGFARSSPFMDDTQLPVATDDNEDLYHFIAYTSINSTLYELDGLQPAPISHGVCTDDSQFAQKLIATLHRRISRYPSSEIRFNLMAMVRDVRIKASASGDAAMLEIERQKRIDWAWENQLRRHNFIGFVGKLSEVVVAEKLKTGKYESWINDAKRGAEVDKIQN